MSNGYDSYFRPGYDPSFDDPWYVSTINRGLNVLGAWASDSPYTAPEDPQFRPHQTTVHQYPQPAPQPGPSPGTQSPPKREGDITISSNMAMLIVGGVLLFMLGSKKGR